MTIADFANGVEVAVRVFTRELSLTSRSDQYDEEELWERFEEYVRQLGLSTIKKQNEADDDIPF